MAQSEKQNRRVVLAARPRGAPTEGTFRLETVDMPVPGDGQVLLRTVYLSLDPYMRGRLNEAASYAKPVDVDAVIVGGTVSRVVSSRSPGLAVGDWVLSGNGWQDYAVADGVEVKKLNPDDGPPYLALGILGMPGFTAYMGLLDIGQPTDSETVVVAAATGAVGATVGQIAKLKGCRVVAIAGGKEKNAYARKELGVDATVDHKDPDFAAKLKAACPDGIDVYYENVGGAVFDAVLPLLNTRARIPVCGLISQYNATDDHPEQDRLHLLMHTILTKRLHIQGFLIDDYGHRYDEFAKTMKAWLRDGKIKHREDIVDGLENAPQAFQGLLEGKNFGKLIIRAGAD